MHCFAGGQRASVRRAPLRNPGRRDASPPEQAPPSVRVAFPGDSAHQGLHARSAHLPAPPMSHAHGSWQEGGESRHPEMPSETPSPYGADRTHGTHKYSGQHPLQETNSRCAAQRRERFPIGHRMYPASHPRGYGRTPPRTWCGYLHFHVGASSTRGGGHQSPSACKEPWKGHRIPLFSPFRSSARSGRCPRWPAFPSLGTGTRGQFRPLQRTCPCFYRLRQQARLSYGPF